MPTPASAIGVFDSGLGGLTVVRELLRVLPREPIVYLGDTARVPYGNKSRETVVKFSTENVLFLLHHDVKAVVVACHNCEGGILETIKEYGLDMKMELFSEYVAAAMDLGAGSAE